MGQDLFIGVDGGGTKSKIRIETADGRLIGQAMSGPANIRLSVEAAWGSIYKGIDEILSPLAISLHDPDYQFYIGLGLAGCEAADARIEFLNRSHPFKVLELCSDAHISCVGAHRGQNGAIIIVGTGVVGYQIQKGLGSKVSGWGFPHDDIGGGAWLGLEAVRLTFQWLDHRIEKCPLVEDVFAFFDNDLEFFTRWANRANSTEFARLAPLVINHAQQEELAGVRLLKKAAHAIDRVHVGLLKTQEKPLPLCLFGGIAPFIEPWLSEELRSHVVTRESDATHGAIHVARHCIQQLEAALK